MKQKIILSAFLFAFSTTIFAQTINNFAPSVPTPEAYSFSRFAGDNVSAYTGTPDITIPVITITDGAAKVPITLRYDASGIKVEEEASWVGLGWNLNVGGHLVHIINGEDDLLGGGDESCLDYLSCIQPVASLNNNFYVTSNQLSCGSDDEIENASRCLFNGYFQPDQYYFEYPGNSGQFYFHYTSAGIDYSTAYFLPLNENIQVTRSIAEGLWILTDEMGVQYSYDLDDGYLTSIVYPNGQEIIYGYEEESTTVTSHIATQLYINESSDPTCYHDTYTPKYLRQISTDNFTIYFNRVSEREDIPGEAYLSSIQVVSKTTGKSRLFKFEYSYFNASLQESKYKNSCPDIDEDAMNKRLKLERFYEEYTDLKGNVKNSNYIFEYNSIDLPPKNSFSRDYWGYYNGANNQELIPFYSQLSEGNELSQVPNELSGTAGRVVKEELVGACMLGSVTTPVGKKTTYTFEPHKFSNFHYKSFMEEKETFDVQVWDDMDPLHSYNNQTFTIEHISEGFPIINIYSSCEYYAHSAYINLYKDNVLIKTWRVGSNQSSLCNYLDEKLRLMPGDYRVVAYFPIPHLDDPCNCTDCDDEEETLSLTPVDELCQDPEARLEMHVEPAKDFSIGAGMRVASIQTVDNITQDTYTTTYVYDDDVTGTYNGILTSPLNYFSIGTLCDETGSGCITCHILYASSNLNLSLNQAAGKVGYSKVEIINNNNSNGKEVQYFNNEQSIYPNPADMICLNLPFIVPILNGTPSRSEIYDKYNNLKTSTSYTYNLDLVDEYFGCISENAGEYSQKVFYPVNSYNISLHTVNSEQWLNGEKVSRLTTFGYNALHQQTSSSVSNDDGSLVQHFVSYPYDEIGKDDGTAQNMVNSHLLAYPMLQENYKNNAFLKSMRISYSSPSLNSYYAPSKIEESFDGVNFREIKSNTYYLNNRIASVKPRNSQVISYMWDYNNNFPVVEAINTTIESVIKPKVAYTSFEVAPDYPLMKGVIGNFKLSICVFSGSHAFSGKKSFAFGGPQTPTISCNLDNTIDYYLSFWAYLPDLPEDYISPNPKNTPITGTGVSVTPNGPALTVTGGSFYRIIDGEVNYKDWKLYKLKISGGTTIELGGTTPVFIDELRLYPTDAYLKTFTYEPLFGKTSEVDINDKISTYQYDNAGRLIKIIDSEGNVVKGIDYNLKSENQ